MGIGLSFFSRKPKITGDMRPGDLSRLQQKEAHQARVRATTQKLSQQRSQRVQRESGQAGEQVGKGVALFARQGMQRPNFSEPQEALRELFGHGEKTMFGTEDSETMVQIHNDLNPRQRGDYSTAQLFGMGGRI